MLRHLIVDSERNLLEKDDLLGTMCYADQIVDAIKNVPNEQAYTIGLYGSWGSGKSTIIRTAKQKLESDRQKRIKMVVYDAWKYSGDSFRRMFLLHLQNELKLSATPEMERFYKATTEELEPNISLRERGLIYLIFSIVAILVAILLVALLGSQDARIWTTLIFSAISIMAASFGGNLFYELKISQKKSILFAPEQFEECFRQMMVKVLKKKSWYKRLWRWVREYFRDEMIPEELDKLVIVVDNLDRCDSGVVYSMLTDIKTFLGGEQYDVVFVIPVDHEALKKHLFVKREDESLDAEEFLRKFFNVVIRIKTHRSDELIHYIHELNRDQKLGFSPNTLMLIAKEYTENPRRILQALNNLTVEQALYGENFAKENETLIAACMILREHYPQMVDAIIRDANVVMNESYYSPSENSAIHKELKTNDLFYAFMRTAKLTLQQATSEEYQKILTNREGALSNLSDAVKNAIDSYNDKEMVSYLQKDLTLRADIFSEIERRVNEASNMDAEDSIVQWVECIAKINQVEPLRPDELLKMNAALSSVYRDVPQKITNADAICQLARDMDNAGISELKHDIFVFIKDKENTQYKSYQDYVRKVFELFSSKVDCENLKDFAEDYFYNDADIASYDFAESQKRYLLTNSFVKKIIGDIKSTKDENQQRLLVWCFDNLIDITTETYNELFAKFTAVVGQRDRKPSGHFLTVIDYVMPVLKVISMQDKTKEQEKFFACITDSRTAPDGLAKPIIMDSDMNEANCEKLADFCFEMYRSSNRHLTINPCSISTQRKCETYVKRRLVQMKQEGIDMMPFRSNINAFVSVDDLWYELVLVSFNKDSKGARSDEATLKQKLKLLYDNREDERALDLLVRVTEEEDVCHLFVSLLNIDDYATLNALPERLLPRIVGLYNAESAERFKTNNAMLKIVLKQNAKNVEEVVTKSLTDRLINNIDVEGVVDVIGSHPKWHYPKYKRQLKATLEGKMPEENDQEVELTDIQKKIKDVLSLLG